VYYNSSEYQLDDALLLLDGQALVVGAYRYSSQTPLNYDSLLVLFDLTPNDKVVFFDLVVTPFRGYFQMFPYNDRFLVFSGGKLYIGYLVERAIVLDTYTISFPVPQIYAYQAVPSQGKAYFFAATQHQYAHAYSLDMTTLVLQQLSQVPITFSVMSAAFTTDLGYVIAAYINSTHHVSMLYKFAWPRLTLLSAYEFPDPAQSVTPYMISPTYGIIVSTLLDTSKGLQVNAINPRTWNISNSVNDPKTWTYYNAEVQGSCLYAEGWGTNCQQNDAYCSTLTQYNFPETVGEDIFIVAQIQESEKAIVRVNGTFAITVSADTISRYPIAC
jgi:hypothetical protein